MRILNELFKTNSFKSTNTSMSKNLSDLSGRKGLEKNLFEELGKAASASGTPSESDLELLRQEFLVGKSSVYGTVS